MPDEGFLTVLGEDRVVSPFFQQADRQFLVHRMILDQQDVEGALQFAQRVAGDQLLGRCRLLILAGAKEPAQRSEQFFGGDRFREKAGNADFLAALAVAAHGAGRQHQHRRHLVERCTQGGGQLVAIHFRHVGIEQDAVELAPFLLDEREGGLAGVGDAWRDAEGTQHAGQDAAVGVVVVDQQNVLAGEVDRWAQGFGRRLVDLQVDREMEGAALAELALQPDFAAHQIDQAARDRQAEAGAAIFAGGRAVFLGKGIKYQLLLFRGNADAGVAHRKMHRGSIAMAGALRDAQRDFAIFGELDGVADQVGQDLTDAAGVAQRMGRHFRQDFADQFDVFLVGAQRHRFQGFRDEAVQVEGNVFDEQFAGLDLREVENVVDDGEQRFGRGFDNRHVLALLIGQRGIEGQIGHADDAVHRRADLVAHVGEEVALRPARRLGGILGQTQLGLGLLAVGDVDDDAEQAMYRAVELGQGRLAINRVMACAVARMHHRLVGLDAGTGQQLLVLGCMQGSILGAEQVVQRAADELLARREEEQLEGAVHAQVATGGILHVHRQRDGLDQFLNHVQLFGELGLHLLAVGNVGADGDVLFGQAVGVEQRHDGRIDPVAAAVAGPVADFAMPYLALADGVPHVAEKFGRMLVRIDDPVVAAEQFVAGIAADLAEAVVGIDDGAGCVGDADDGVLVEGELLVGQCAAPGFALIDQGGEALCQRAEVFLGQDQRIGLGRGIRQQVTDRIAYRAERALALAQLAAQLVIEAGELLRRDFQAACAQFEVALVLLVGSVNPLQQFAEAVEQAGQLGIGVTRGALQLVQQLAKRRLVGNADGAFQLAEQGLFHGRGATAFSFRSGR